MTMLAVFGYGRYMMKLYSDAIAYTEDESSGRERRLKTQARDDKRSDKNTNTAIRL